MTLEFVGLEICVPDLIWTIINFFILLFLLKRFLFRPILQFMDKRNELIRDGIKQGELAMSTLKNKEEKGMEEVRQCRAESVKQISKAREHSEEERTRILEEAAGDSRIIKEKFAEELKEEEKDARKRTEKNLQEYVRIFSERLLSVKE